MRRLLLCNYFRPNSRLEIWLNLHNAFFVQTFRSSTCGFLTSHHGKSRLSLQGGLTLGAAAASNGDATRAMLIVELPAEILFKILSYMSFKEISYLRMVSQINYSGAPRRIWARQGPIFYPKIFDQLFLIPAYWSPKSRQGPGLGGLASRGAPDIFTNWTFSHVSL